MDRIRHLARAHLHQRLEEIFLLLCVGDGRLHVDLEAGEKRRDSFGRSHVEELVHGHLPRFGLAVALKELLLEREDFLLGAV